VSTAQHSAESGTGLKGLTAL